MKKWKDFNCRGAWSRRGTTTTEFFFAILILTLALIPIYDIFVGSYKTVFRSKFGYLGQHAARELAEELAQVPFAQLTDRAHDWQPLQGHVFQLSVLASPVDQADTSLEYPEEYKRLETKLSFEDVPDPLTPTVPCDRLKKAIIEIRWQEKGTGGRVKNKILEKFEIIIANQYF